VDAGNRPHALPACAESWMPQKAPDEQGGVIGAHIQPGQTVVRMTGLRFEKIEIAREEGRLLQSQEQGKYLPISAERGCATAGVAFAGWR
jgi:hypothetical protein